MLEHIAQQIIFKQVELATFLGNFKNSFKNAASLFAKLCDVSGFTKEIKEKLNKINNDMQASALSFQSNPSSSISHHSKIKYLAALQAELLKKEARIRENLIEIQNMLLPILGSMQKHIQHCKTLTQHQSFSIADHMIELSAEVQIALSSCQILQDSWDNTLATILKVHQEFLSHFGVTL